MPSPIITVENLSKRYRIRHQQAGPRDGLRHVLNYWVTAPFRLRNKIRPPPFAEATAGKQDHGTTDCGNNGSIEDFWALKDVSFDIRQGEVIGIIGRNGAGKSTLLKILSRITEPTEGRVRIKGRVASLLEVGTGFHPELTGRENIFLNGAILGMSRVEIRKKFDEIVAFAEIEKFLDTPVKRYSSGMYVRLAFAVAAHLDPEILIVDEVLAVGDADFQKKCLGKMKEVSGSGRTLLFVSHSMPSVGALCSRGVMLERGSIVTMGGIAEVVNAYLKGKADQQGQVVWLEGERCPGNGRVRMRAVRTLQSGQVTGNIDMGRALEVQVEYEVLTQGRTYVPSIHLLDRNGACILATGNGPAATTGKDPWAQRPMPAGRYCASCFIPDNFLNEGRYLLSAFVTDGARIEAQAPEVLAFETHDTGTMRDDYHGVWIGQIRPRLAWSTAQVP